MRSLLDISVVIALIDPDHTLQDMAHDWWKENYDDGWASCPITENGVVRIMSTPTYSPTVRFAPKEVINKVREFIKGTNHAFYQDEISLMDGKVFDPDRIHSAKKITDLYLLALAVKNGGRLVTFDQGISLAGVKGAKAESLWIV